MACACVGSAQLVKMRRSLLNMGHGIVSYGKMVKIKTGLGCEGLCASVKGNLVEVVKCE